MKRTIVGILILTFGMMYAQGQIDSRQSAGKFQLNITSKINYFGSGEAEVDYFSGHLIDNDYQTILSYSNHDKTAIHAFGDVDSCLHYTGMLGKRAREGKKVTINEQYMVEVYDISTSFEKIDSIYGYDKTSLNYKQYTKSNKPFIDLNNPYLKQLSDSIWNASENHLEFVRHCYEYVASHFNYGDPLTGFHPIIKILNNGGGDCGNLSSIWVNLLRIQGVPARHIVGFRPDESLHVWAEFYLEQYGWIPVDVTYKQSNPEGDYFGNIKFANNGFVIHRDIGQTVNKKSGIARVASLQTYSYDVNSSRQTTTEVIVSRNILAKELGSDTE